MKLNIWLLVVFIGLPLISMAESDDSRITKLEEEVKKLKETNEEILKRVSDKPGTVVRRKVVPIPQKPNEAIKEVEPKEVVEIYQDHSYRFIPVKKSWHLAKNDASKRGGYLVVLNTAEENVFINNLIMKASAGGRVLTWIGLNNDNEEHKWQWVNGAEFEYSNWGPGEPNSPEECSAHLGLYEENPDWKGKWNNSCSDLQFYYVVESENTKK